VEKQRERARNALRHEDQVFRRGHGSGRQSRSGNCACARRLDPDNWKSTLEYIKIHGFWALLTNAVSKEIVKDYVKEHKAPPPGVKYSEYRDLAWTRGNK